MVLVAKHAHARAWHTNAAKVWPSELASAAEEGHTWEDAGSTGAVVSERRFDYPVRHGWNEVFRRLMRRFGRRRETMGDSNARQLAIELARITDELKCDDVTVMDLRGISPVTDFTVIATGTSDRQMRAVTDRILEYGKTVGERPFGVSGYATGTWILIDFVDVVVHVFACAHREYYDLELLWGDAPRPDWVRSQSA